MTDDDADEILEREKMIFEDPREAPRVGATVLRLRNTRLDLETFAPLLVERLHVPKFEATKLCQLPHGVLLDNIDPALAEAVAQDLRARGEDCLVVPAAKILKLPRPRPVHSMRLSKSGLAFRSTTDDWYSVRWDDLACLAMGQAAVEETRRTTQGLLTRRITAPGSLAGDPLSTIASAVAPRSNVSVSKTTSQHLLLEFASLVPLAYCRIDGRQFDYSILGDQLQNSSALNIQTLARWLLTYAPQMQSNIDVPRLMQTGSTGIPPVGLHGLMEVSEWLANLSQFQAR